MSSEMSIIGTAMALYAAGVVSPGPNFALISRLAVSGAKPAAVGATLGLATAATFYAILTMTGLALILTRIGWLASLIQIAGGCYLIYLGLRSWLSEIPATATHPASADGVGLRGFRTGFLVNLSNPKVIAFFVSLYAVAVPPQTALWIKLLILTGGFLLEIFWYGLVIALLSTAPVRAVHHRFGLWAERAIGTLLAGFGVRLITDSLLTEDSSAASWTTK
jgi:threonine/homoserine/homoserine lactone efflux protein